MVRRAHPSAYRLFLPCLGGGLALMCLLATARVHGQEPQETPRQKVERLLQAVNSPNADVRLATVTILGDRGQMPVTEQERPQLENPEAVGIVIQNYLRDVAGAEVAKHASPRMEPDPRVRRAALIALGRLRARAEDAVPVWREALKDPNREARLAVVQALMSYVTRSAEIKKILALREAEKEDKLQKMVDQVHDVAALPGVFSAAIHDPDADVQSNALRALLAMLKDLSAMESPIPDVAVGTARAAALREQLPRLANGLKSLSADLDNVLTRGSPEQQLLCLDILRELADLRDMRSGAIMVDAKLPPKPRGRLVETDMGVQGVEAAKTLGEALQEALPLVAGKLTADRSSIRLAALALIEQLGTEAKPAVKQVAAALRDPDRFVRWAAARSLGRLGATNYRPAIDGLAELTGDGDLDVAMAAARAVEEYGEAAVPAVPALAKALDRDDPELRLSIIMALKRIGPAGAGAVEPLTQLLEAKESRIRREVPPLLAVYGPRARPAIPALRAALNDADPEVRERAGAALLQIFGK